ncbi:MAG: hypothetical protein IJ011_09865 [Clostridia bacterium]|nr:hypothetical protein [Clostridia bacterium]
MVKYNYFEDLEKLSELSLSAVCLACGTEEKANISDIRRECDRLVCKTEDALFSDFLPPLERDNIAATAHCLSRIIDTVSELTSDPSATATFMKTNEEAAVCIKLSEELRNGIFLLRRIRKPDENPDLQGYRQLLSEGRNAHKRMLAKVRSGALSKKHAEAIILTGRLRSELSTAFDELIEIMLNNI